jgi:site-specific DNA-methyltransferase (adenine-specific)
VSFGSHTVHHGDCIDWMETLPDDCVHAVCCDPPYGLLFMNSKWDDLGQGRQQEEWHKRWLVEAYRVLKPGGHLLAFGGSRTFHRLFSAAEDVGFEIRDTIMWIQGQGFPKGTNFGKKDPRFKGWNSQLKPAHEPCLLGRKPIKGTGLANMQAHGVGGLNIDATRIAAPGEVISTHSRSPEASAKKNRPVYGEYGAMDTHQTEGQKLGRWPANVIFQHLDECKQAGTRKDVCGGGAKGSSGFANGYDGEGFEGRTMEVPNWICAPGCPVARLDDTGGASRFFYCAKVTRKERAETRHPTQKPIKLIRYLVRLVTPKGGIVLDPFLGSGTTLLACEEEGMICWGSEIESQYIEFIEKRWQSREAGAG